MRLSLAMQIRILVALVAVGFGLCVMVAFRMLAARQIASAVRQDVASVTSALKMIVRSRGEMLRSSSQFLGTSPRLAMLAQTDDPATVQDQMGVLLRDSGTNALCIANSSGRLLGKMGFSPSASVARDTRDGIDAALRGQTWVSLKDVGNELLLMASHPLAIDGKVWGAVVVCTRIGDAEAVQIADAVRADVAFVHGGRIIAASLPHRGLRIGPRGDTMRLDIAGRPYLARWAALDDTAKDMGVLALRDVSAAEAVYREFTGTFLLVLALVTLVAFAAGAALAQNMVRPLTRVVEAAKAVQKGEWPESFAVSRKDEIGLLQRVFNDMTASLRTSQDKLLGMIHVDPLTELMNHRSFQERLDQEAHRTSASGEDLSLVLLDIDRFKDFNRNRGHAAGDDVLRSISKVLTICVPEFAVISRFGPDRFAVLLPQQDIVYATGLAEEVKAGLAEFHVPVSISAGCAQNRGHNREANGIVLAAELALTRAKQLGGDGVCEFESVPGASEGADPFQVHEFLRDGTLATIQALAAAVDAKDNYTRGHSERVATYARDLCAYVGGGADEVDRVFRSGTLHDVGKIGVPDAILKKPGRLDEDERRQMETHPVLGELIVRKVPQLEELLPGVRHHHERWDGKGYPDGLQGEAIPRVARLLAIADTFDAMTSDRPYRKGMNMHVALDEIAKGAGTQFDPELAHAFVSMMGDQAMPLAA